MSRKKTRKGAWLTFFVMWLSWIEFLDRERFNSWTKHWSLLKLNSWIYWHASPCMHKDLKRSGDVSKGQNFKQYWGKWGCTCLVESSFSIYHSTDFSLFYLDYPQAKMSWTQIHPANSVKNCICLMCNVKHSYQTSSSREVAQSSDKVINEVLLDLEMNTGQTFGIIKPSSFIT